MLFKNLKTGQFVETENAVTIKLMEQSDNYELANIPETVVEKKTAPKKETHSKKSENQ